MIFQVREALTDAQYGSSAGMVISSDNLNIPFLKTSFESEAPIMMRAWHVRRVVEESCKLLVWLFALFDTIRADDE